MKNRSQVPKRSSGKGRLPQAGIPQSPSRKSRIQRPITLVFNDHHGKEVSQLQLGQAEFAALEAGAKSQGIALDQFVINALREMVGQAERMRADKLSVLMKFNGLEQSISQVGALFDMLINTLHYRHHCKGVLDEQVFQELELGHVILASNTKLALKAGLDAAYQAVVAMVGIKDQQPA